MGGKGSGQKKGHPAIRGAGRKKGSGGKNEKLAVRIKPELLTRLRDTSKLTSISQSVLVESALTGYLNRLVIPDKDGLCKASDLIV